MSYTSEHRRRWEPTGTVAVAGSECPQTTWAHASRGASYAWSPTGILACFHRDDRWPTVDLEEASRIVDAIEGIERG